MGFLLYVTCCFSLVALNILCVLVLVSLISMCLGVFLDESEESEKVGLKLDIQKMKIMASGPITSWEIDGETVSDFIFWGSKITADGDCSHEIKRRLLLGKKL